MGIRRLTGATAAITLTLQVLTMGLAAASWCVDRPHRHGGVPAPDCPMHHQPAAVDGSSAHHHHHAVPPEASTSDTGRLSCRCPSDTLSFLIGPIGVIPDAVSVQYLTSTASKVTTFTPAPLDIRIAPLSPPPRRALS